jgi:gas vesicle protein
MVKGFFVGALVGGVVAWLFAPCKGAQLRAWIDTTLREQFHKTWTTIRMVLPGDTDD